MKVAVMQPYFLPYIGYFQLIESVDTFVFYDDVSFIKSGWINRNNLLLNNQAHLFTIPCKNISSFIPINETLVDSKSKRIPGLIMKIEQAYKKAPFYNEVIPLVYNILQNTELTIAQLAAKSVMLTYEYLGLTKEFKFSSIAFSDTKNLDRAERLVAITKKLSATDYINPKGGQELYSKSYFQAHGITLYFLQSVAQPYPQFKQEFTPNLSILDVMMFNSKEEIKKMLNQYTLV